LNVMPYS